MKHTHAHKHTQQLSLVFLGKAGPTPTPWVLGSRAKRGRKGKVGEGGRERKNNAVHVMQGAARREGRKGSII